MVARPARHSNGGGHHVRHVIVEVGRQMVDVDCLRGVLLQRRASLLLLWRWRQRNVGNKRSGRRIQRLRHRRHRLWNTGEDNAVTISKANLLFVLQHNRFFNARLRGQGPSRRPRLKRRHIGIQRRQRFQNLRGAAKLADRRQLLLFRFRLLGPVRRLPSGAPLAAG